MLKFNLSKINNTVSAIEAIVNKVVVVGPKSEITVTVDSGNAPAVVTQAVANSYKELGIDMRVSNSAKVEKLDIGSYKLIIDSTQNLNSPVIMNNGFENTIKGLHKKVVLENTKVNFMNRIAADYGKSIADDDNLGVGQITIASNNFSAIALLDDASFKTLATKALITVFGRQAILGSNGVGEYYGLFVESLKADNVELDLVTVSFDQEEMIKQEILSCDLTDVKNLRKIFTDINDLYRMYQELTIDAAKKLITVIAAFYTECIKADSTIALDHNFTSFNDLIEATDAEALEELEKDNANKISLGLFDEVVPVESKFFQIDRTRETCTPKNAPVGEFIEYEDEDEDEYIVAFKDRIASIQDAICGQFEPLINNDVLNKYKEVTVSPAIAASFSFGSEFNAFAADLYEALRKPYSKLNAWKSEEVAKATDARHAKKISAYACSKRIDEVNAMYNDKIAELSNLARYLTKDLDMALAGRLMFMISNIKREKQTWVVDTDSTNQLFLTVAPELFTAYVVAEHAEMNVCGYKVLGDVDGLVEGQELTFVHGNAQEVENVYVDADFNGKLTVQMVNDVLSVVKPIEIPRIEATVPTTMAISVYESSVVNATHFASTKEYVKTSKFETLINQKVFEKAEKIQLVPFYSYSDANGRTRHVYNAIVATIPSLNDPSVKFEIPVCQYLCNSASYEKSIAGLTCNKVNNIRIDGKTMRILLDFGNFEEVELNHAKEENDLFEEVNNDPFASFVQVSNKSFEDAMNDPFAQSEAPAPVSYKVGDEAFGTGYSISDDIESIFAELENA